MATTQTATELGPVVGGDDIRTGETYEVRSPYDDALVAVVHRARPREIESAIAGAVRAFETTRKLPSWKRSEILAGIATRIEAAKDDFARTLAREAEAREDRARRGGARRVHVPHRVRRGKAHLRRDRPARLDPRERRTRGTRAARAARPDRRHQPVQLPAQPRLAQ